MAAVTTKQTVAEVAIVFPTGRASLLKYLSVLVSFRVVFWLWSRRNLTFFSMHM